jgi:hypothetical protein
MAAKKPAKKPTKAKLPKSGPKGGRPRTRFAVGAMEFGDADDRKLNLSDRKELEKFCQDTLREQISDQRQTKADIRTILDALRIQIAQSTAKGSVDLSLLRVFEQQQQRFRQVGKDLTQNLSSMVKQFKLFTELSPEDEGGGTPVTLVINTEPPEGTVVPNKFELGEEHVDPDRQAG